MVSKEYANSTLCTCHNAGHNHAAAATCGVCAAAARTVPRHAGLVNSRQPVRSHAPSLDVDTHCPGSPVASWCLATWTPTGEPVWPQRWCGAAPPGPQSCWGGSAGCDGECSSGAMLHRSGWSAKGTLWPLDYAATHKASVAGIGVHLPCMAARCSKCITALAQTACC